MPTFSLMIQICFAATPLLTADYIFRVPYLKVKTEPLFKIQIP